VTDRHTVDSITSDALDQVYADRDRYETVIAELRDALAALRADITLDRAQQWPQRLGRAEAAITRVREWAAGLDAIAIQVAGEGTRHPVADHIRHLLAPQPEPADRSTT
jgi:hypothetical protein